jgi:hypothetical protein
MASFQCLLCKASSRLCGSPDVVKQPYLIVPSVYTLGFLMPLWSLVLGEEDPTQKIQEPLTVAGALTAAGEAALTSGEEDPVQVLLSPVCPPNSELSVMWQPVVRSLVSGRKASLSRRHARLSRPPVQLNQQENQLRVLQQRLCLYLLCSVLHHILGQKH